MKAYALIYWGTYLIDLTTWCVGYFTSWFICINRQAAENLDVAGYI